MRRATHWVGRQVGQRTRGSAGLPAPPLPPAGRALHKLLPCNGNSRGVCVEQQHKHQPVIGGRLAASGAGGRCCRRRWSSRSSARPPKPAAPAQPPPERPAMMRASRRALARRTRALWTWLRLCRPSTPRGRRTRQTRLPGWWGALRGTAAPRRLLGRNRRAGRWAQRSPGRQNPHGARPARRPVRAAAGVRASARAARRAAGAATRPRPVRQRRPPLPWTQARGPGRAALRTLRRAPTQPLQRARWPLWWLMAQRRLLRKRLPCGGTRRSRRRAQQARQGVRRRAGRQAGGPPAAAPIPSRTLTATLLSPGTSQAAQRRWRRSWRAWPCAPRRRQRRRPRRRARARARARRCRMRGRRPSARRCTWRAAARWTSCSAT